MAQDLRFVRTAVARFYGRNGNPSVDPEVLVKMLLLLFLDDVSSEREFVRIMPKRLDYLWFLGYKIDDAIPNHSVLSKARERWGAEVFESIFIRTVEQCSRAKARRDRQRASTSWRGSLQMRQTITGLSVPAGGNYGKQSIQHFLIAALQNLILLIARGRHKPTLRGVASIRPIAMQTNCKTVASPHLTGIGLAFQSPSQSHLLAKFTSPHNSAPEATNQHRGVNLFSAAGILSINARFTRFGNTPVMPDPVAPQGEFILPKGSLLPYQGGRKTCLLGQNSGVGYALDEALPG